MTLYEAIRQQLEEMFHPGLSWNVTPHPAPGPEGNRMVIDVRWAQAEVTVSVYADWSVVEMGHRALDTLARHLEYTIWRNTRL